MNNVNKFNIETIESFARTTNANRVKAPYKWYARAEGEKLAEGENLAAKLIKTL